MSLLHITKYDSWLPNIYLLEWIVAGSSKVRGWIIVLDINSYMFWKRTEDLHNREALHRAGLEFWLFYWLPLASNFT